MDYGLNISFDKNVIYSEKIGFIITFGCFYTHDELKTTKGYK
jgi:hypothetical protein